MVINAQCTAGLSPTVAVAQTQTQKVPQPPTRSGFDLFLDLIGVAASPDISACSYFDDSHSASPLAFSFLLCEYMLS